MDYVDKMSDFGKIRVNRSLRTALNKFFKENPYMADGCIFRKDWGNADYTLIIEGSNLRDELEHGIGEGAMIMYEEFGIKPKMWVIHTAWHKAFEGCDYYPEMQNSCVITFWKN